jgi:hypothetical protein
MKFHLSDERGLSTLRRAFAKFFTLGAASVLLLVGFTFATSSLASAAGTSANTITPGAAPSAGSARGSYTPSAKATSGDTVAITLDATSTGCSLASGKVTFTGSGTCVVDFNDAGNATYAAAAEVHQSIKVYSANTIDASKAPSAGSAGGSYSPGATATSGDSVVKSLASTSTGCTYASGKVTFTGAGTCRVDFNDAGNGAFAAAAQVRQNITVHAANTIHPSTPPGAGTIHGTYTASAYATSGDTVAITLDSTSTGCSIDKKVVTFTGNGVCRVDFNDVGNGAFAAAHEVQQSITVGAGNPTAQATLTLTSTHVIHGHSLTLTSSGGSGTGAVSYAVTTMGTAGCTVDGNVLKAIRIGTCTVTVTKAADSTYASAQSLATTVTITARHPRAIRFSSAVWTGRTVSRQITGTEFYGLPRVISNAPGTRIKVLRDNGRVLTVRVTVKAHTIRGVHTLTLVFARGQRTSLKYSQR